MTSSSRNATRPVLARDIDVAKANAINTLLIRPIAILPEKIGDPIRPFALGLWNEIRPLLRPGLSVSQLRRAAGAYLHSKRYYITVAQPGSVRHDIDGLQLESVSDADRMAAQEKCNKFKKRDGHAALLALTKTPTSDQAPR